MKLGIFAKTFTRPTFAGVLDAITTHGLQQVQFNLLCVGLPTMPERIDPVLIGKVREAFEVRQLKMAALSGTFNMIHPDAKIRSEGLARLKVLAQAAPDLGTRRITLCTGTRNPENMWSGHPENGSEAAWSDLLEAMEVALGMAEEAGVVLLIEPEVTNVVNSAGRARQLLDHFRSRCLKVVIDPANLVHAGELPRMREVMDEAFGRLGPDIVLAHAKDLSRDGEAGHEAAGTGVLDFDVYLEGLERIGFNGALIMHGLAEEQVGQSVMFLRKKFAERRSSRATQNSHANI